MMQSVTGIVKYVEQGVLWYYNQNGHFVRFKFYVKTEHRKMHTFSTYSALISIRSSHDDLY